MRSAGPSHNDDRNPQSYLRRGHTVSVVVVLLLVLMIAWGSLWYVMAPPRGAADYAHRSAQTAVTLRSQAVTAERWADLVEEDRATREAAVVAFEEAEAAAESAISQQGSWDPPPRTSAAEARSSLQTAGQELVSALADMRISAHRGDWESVPRHAGRLPALASRFTRIERRFDRLEREARR